METTTPSTVSPLVRERTPTWRDLPSTDHAIVNNPYQTPQLSILSDSLTSWLAANHPNGDVFIGSDTGIYFQQTKPPMLGCRAPDWFYVPGVPAMEDGDIVLSYVMWQHQYQPPFFLVELVSSHDGGELDRTPETGKFWIYENRIRAEYYVVFDTFNAGDLQVFHLENNHYQQLEPNAAGRYAIPKFGYELGVVFETHNLNIEGYYLRFFTPDGVLVPLSSERHQQAEERLKLARKELTSAVNRSKIVKRQIQMETTAREIAEQRAEAEKQRAEAEKQRAEAEKQRAEAEKQRAEAAEKRLAELLQQLGQQSSGVNTTASDAET